MILDDPHLIQFCYRLNLQVEDYKLFKKAWEIESLRPKNYEELAKLCQQLWGKSQKEQEKIGKAFKDFEKDIKAIFERENSEVSPKKESTGKNIQELNTGNKKPSLSQKLPIPTGEIEAENRVFYASDNIDEEVVTAIPQPTKSEFILNDEYFTLTRAQLTKGWGSLRKSSRTEKETELDIPATVKRFCDENIAELVYRPIRENQVELLLLIDQGDSMIPVSLIAERLIETAKGIFKSLKVFYFRNSPRNALFADSELLEKYSLDIILTQLHSTRTQVVIFSDGGAREIIPSEVRINLINTFIDLLKPTVQQIVWLNPLPERYWQYTSAEKIANLVPMFPFDVLGWQELLRMLRGKTTPPSPRLAKGGNWKSPLSEGEDWKSRLSQGEDWKSRPSQGENWKSPLSEGKDWKSPLSEGGDWKSPLSEGEDWKSPLSQGGNPKSPLSKGVGGRDEESLDALYDVLEIEEKKGKHEEAIETLSEFTDDFPEYINLAFHAAFPLAITPDLLYYFRENFAPESPWIAVPDLLLSSLFESIGGKLYQMDSGVRHLLLKSLKIRFGNHRLNQLSEALLFYLQQGLEESIENTEFGENPDWIALGYTQRTELAKQLAARLQKSLTGTQEDKIKTASLTATFAEALAELEFQPLLKLARGLARQGRGYEEGAQEIFDQLPSEIDIAGVKLKIPGKQRLPLKTFTFETVTVNRKGEIIHRETKEAQYFTENLGETTLEMVYIPGGTFTMGSPEGEGYSYEKPQHQVTIKPFLMGKYPVTQVQWEAVMGYNPSGFKGENRPVEKVSWYDTIEFSVRLSQKTGKNYRLPSEAEWEYACRAGTTTPFHFGETITPDLANYDRKYKYREGLKGIYPQEMTPVGSFQVANAFGLYDMHGNVWEWCADPWHDNYEGAPTDGSVWDENNNDNHYKKYIDLLVNIKNDNRTRLLRGGSWFGNADSCRAAYRYDNSPDNRDYDFGFRVVCSGAWTS